MKGKKSRNVWPNCGHDLTHILERLTPSVAAMQLQLGASSI